MQEPKAKTAIVIGATGLVGGALLRQLLNDARFSRVVALLRRSTGLSHPKLQEHLVDFDHREGWQSLPTGDILFSAMGTTRKDAGSKAAQYRVDYQYQLDVAEAACKQGVGVLVLVSSVGANPSSAWFYPRIKGELEWDVRLLGFGRLVILRPGPLSGKRPRFRLGEAVGVSLIRLANRLGLLRDYRPITGEQMARAMIRTALDQTPGTLVYAASQLHHLAAAGQKDLEVGAVEKKS